MHKTGTSELNYYVCIYDLCEPLKGLGLGGRGRKAFKRPLHQDGQQYIRFTQLFRLVVRWDAQVWIIKWSFLPDIRKSRRLFSVTVDIEPLLLFTFLPHSAKIRHTFRPFGTHGLRCYEVLWFDFICTSIVPFIPLEILNFACGIGYREVPHIKSLLGIKAKRCYDCIYLHLSCSILPREILHVAMVTLMQLEKVSEISKDKTDHLRTMADENEIQAWLCHELVTRRRYHKAA